eukprot:m.173280 g.173280  ORF g.173280 m.173280 type:complete len:71 (+) comp31720_c1_seq1:280-492(+)
MFFEVPWVVVEINLESVEGFSITNCIYKGYFSKIHTDDHQNKTPLQSTCQSPHLNVKYADSVVLRIARRD